jgi:hypothetical protein
MIIEIEGPDLTKVLKLNEEKEITKSATLNDHLLVYRKEGKVVGEYPIEGSFKIVRFLNDNPNYLLLIDECTEGKEINRTLEHGTSVSVRHVRKWK